MHYDLIELKDHELIFDEIKITDKYGRFETIIKSLGIKRLRRLGLEYVTSKDIFPKTKQIESASDKETILTYLLTYLLT